MAITATNTTTSAQALDLSSGKTYDVGAAGSGTTKPNDKLAGSKQLSVVTIQNLGVVTAQVCGDSTLQPCFFGQAAQPATPSAASSSANAPAEKGSGGTKVTAGDDDTWTVKRLHDEINDSNPDEKVTWKEAGDFVKVANEEGWDADDALEAIREERAMAEEEKTEKADE